jgi:hypothetical protein
VEHGAGKEQLGIELQAASRPLRAALDRFDIASSSGLKSF